MLAQQRPQQQAVFLIGAHLLTAVATQQHMVQLARQTQAG
jgi:hypothetical protein